MYDVITIGTATRDIFIESDSIQVVNDPKHLKGVDFHGGQAECVPLGAKIEIKQPTIAIGGGGANAAVTFARQGHKVGSIIKIGNEEVGEEIVKALKKEGIKVDAVYDEKRGTALSIILLSSSGERTIFVYRGASEQLKKDEVINKINKAKWAYIVPGKISFPVIQNVVKTLKEQKIKIAMNPSRFYLEDQKNKLLTLFKDIDVVLVNREEAAMAIGEEYENENGIFKKFDQLVKGIAVVTNGENGACVSDGKHVYKVGIFKEKKRVNRTGAGDAFGSGFVSGLLSCEKEIPQLPAIQYALRIASANAASVVEHMGAQKGILTKEELNQKRWHHIPVTVTPLR